MPPRKNTGALAAPTRQPSSRIQAAASTAKKRKADADALETQAAVTKRRKTTTSRKMQKPKSPAANASSKRVAAAAAAAAAEPPKVPTSTKANPAKTAKPESTKAVPKSGQKATATATTTNSKKSSKKVPAPKKSSTKSALKETSSSKNTAKAKAPANGVQKQSQKPSAKAALANKRRAAAAKGWATRRRNAIANATTQPQAPSASQPTPTSRSSKPAKVLPAINHAPTQVLDVFVCGAGENGELGLGTDTTPNATNVRRPRLHPLLAAHSVGVVQIAAGGMHCAALTKDGTILTWGVNDDGALGRGDTAATAAMLDTASSDPHHNGLNPNECTPMEIPSSRFPPGTVITKLAAGDSITLALTAQGHVYGWGLFRDNNGVFGFSKEHAGKQEWPVRIAGLERVVDIACGDNHCLALTAGGRVLSWGAFEQSQLGRRVVERHRLGALCPAEFGLRRVAVTRIFTGCYHSFALDSAGRVWTWGLNNCGQTGVAEGAGEDGAVVQPPALVTALAGRAIVAMKGGSHHTVALDAAGAVLAWDKADGGQLGISLVDGTVAPGATLPNHSGEVGAVLTPQAVPGIGPASWVTCGTDHNIALTPSGQAYAWGMAASHQTGLGQAECDVVQPELVDNSAVRGRALTWAGAGGQFSIFTSPAAQSVV